MSATVTTRSNGRAESLNERSFPALRGKLVRPPVASAAPAQRILAVEFRSTDGRSWNAIGGGATVAAAIDWARECCPNDTTWELAGWEDLYGD